MMEPSRNRVLVVDDEPAIRDMMCRALRGGGFAAEAAARPSKALEIEDAASIQLVITDLMMPGMNGIELMKEARRRGWTADFILMTGHATVETAVEAMKMGAFDYFTKPVQLEEILLRVERALANRKLNSENVNLRHALRSAYVGEKARLVGRTPEMRRVLEMIDLVGRNNSNVFVLGETGTGKELVARAIHYGSARAAGPFVPINCGSVTKTLLESRLFGHLRGSFTGAVKDSPGVFASAEGGTLFLDEITEIEPDVQVSLLRAIQEREITPVGGASPRPVDVRIIAASNRNIPAALEEGALRQDLYYRLAVVEIQLPPLRERRGDIPELIESFNSRMSESYGMPPREIAPEAMDALLAYDWPGNVRQLENAMERAFALARSDELGLADLPLEIRGISARAPQGGGESQTLSDAEKQAVVQALKETDGNKAEAARALGIERSRLYRLLHKHGLLSE